MKTLFRLLPTLALALAAQNAHPQALATADIYDSAFNNMKAVEVTIPAGWKLQGTIALNPCDNYNAWPAFRAYSPDGLTEMRIMPIFAWRWRPNLRNLDKSGCLPLTGQLSAAEFLDKYIEMIPGGVHVVGPMSVAAEFKKNAQTYADNMNASGANGPANFRSNHTADTASLRIQTHNGSFTVEHRLRVAVECAVSPDTTGPMVGGTCWCRLDILRAPVGKLDALVHLVDTNNLPRGVGQPQWKEAVMRRQQQRAQQMMAALTAQEQAASNMLKKQHDDFMATMQHNHEAFQAQQESSFRSSMNNANNAMNARTTAASDWVDYALDQQTVTGSGGTAKVSSSYTHTWSNGQKQWYQTNDPSANPNGALYGNWTEDTKVHGNGQSY
jgi:hypothetical protein